MRSPSPVQTTPDSPPHQTRIQMQRETREVALIVSTPALAGPGQPEAPPSPHLDRWHVKTTPTRFPRAGPCPRCPAVQVTTPSPCPSVPVHDRSTFPFLASLSFFDPVTPTYTPSRPHHLPPCIALQRSQDPRPPDHAPRFFGPDTAERPSSSRSTPTRPRHPPQR